MASGLGRAGALGRRGALGRQGAEAEAGLPSTAPAAARIAHVKAVITSVTASTETRLVHAREHVITSNP